MKILIILLFIIPLNLNAQVFEHESWKLKGHKVISISAWGKDCKEKVKKAKPQNFRYIGGVWTFNNTLNPNYYKEFYIKRKK